MFTGVQKGTRMSKVAWLGLWPASLPVPANCDLADITGLGLHIFQFKQQNKKTTLVKFSTYRRMRAVSIVWWRKDTVFQLSAPEEHEKASRRESPLWRRYQRNLTSEKRPSTHFSKTCWYSFPGATVYQPCFIASRWPASLHTSPSGQLLGKHDFKFPRNWDWNANCRNSNSWRSSSSKSTTVLYTSWTCIHFFRQSHRSPSAYWTRNETLNWHNLTEFKPLIGDKDRIQTQACGTSMLLLWPHSLLRRTDRCLDVKV